MRGLDYSWGRPNLQAVKDAGFSFVVRYVSFGGGGKNITKGEADQIRGAGLGLSLVWETYVGRPLEGHDAGVVDAREALAQARAIGYPDSVPIYFAVDFDAYEHQQDEIDAYLRGAAEVIGAGRVGVYGGYYVVKRCFDNGSAKHLWQTYAWSGGQWDSRATLRQVRNGQNVGGAEVDFNESLEGFVCWGAGTPAQPTPAPTPAPSPSGTYTVKAGDTLSGIAGRFGTTYQELARINGIPNPNVISVGQVIKLSGSAAPASTPAPAEGSYTVKPGDTLSGIAAKFNTTYQELARINGIPDPNKINAGQVIKVGGSVAQPQPSDSKTHTVKSGETLSSIAALYGTSWQRLQQLNNIPNANLIYPNQVLRVG